jgi:SMC interacting uncharacterized protein involved in chromosome segregation
LFGIIEDRHFLQDISTPAAERTNTKYYSTLTISRNNRVEPAERGFKPLFAFLYKSQKQHGTLMAASRFKTWMSDNLI